MFVLDSDPKSSSRAAPRSFVSLVSISPFGFSSSFSGGRASSKTPRNVWLPALSVPKVKLLITRRLDCCTLFLSLVAPVTHHRGLRHWPASLQWSTRTWRMDLPCITSQHPSCWRIHLPWIEYICSSLTSSATGMFPFMPADGFWPLAAQEMDVAVLSIQVHLCCCLDIWRTTCAALIHSSLYTQCLADISIQCFPGQATDRSPFLKLPRVRILGKRQLRIPNFLGWCPGGGAIPSGDTGGL